MADAQTGEQVASFEEILLKAYSEEAPTADEIVQEDGSIPSGQTPDELLEGAEQVETQGEEQEVEVEAQDEESEKREDQKALEDTPAFNQLGKKAQGRIRELVEVRNKQQEQLEAIQTSLAQERAQYQQYLQQVQYQAQLRDQQMQQELLRYRAEMEALRQTREEQALAEKFSKDPVAKFEHEVLSKARREAEALAQARVADIERQLRAQAETQDRVQREAAKKERFARWTGQLKQAVPEVLLHDIEDKEVASKLSPDLENFLLAYAAAGAEEPAVAAKGFAKVINQLVDLKTKSAAKAKGAVVAKNKGLPGASGAGKSGAAAGATLESRPPPPKHVLGEMGFSTVWEWRRAGSPPPPVGVK